MIEGRPALAAFPPGARGAARALSCERCGAPSREVPGGVHEPIVVACGHCGAVHALSPELEQELRATRVATALARWGRASDESATATAWIAGGSRAWSSLSPPMLAAVLGVPALGALGLAVLAIAARLGVPTPILGALALSGVAVAGVGALGAAALALGRLVAPSDVRAWWSSLGAAPRPAAAPPELASCAGCGAPLEARLARTIGARCDHCGADTVPDRAALEAHVRQLAEHAARAQSSALEATRDADGVWRG